MGEKPKELNQPTTYVANGAGGTIKNILNMKTFVAVVEERDAALKELEETKAEADEWKKFWDLSDDKNRELAKDLAIAREALEFYANENGDSDSDREGFEIIHRGKPLTITKLGKRAREVLKQLSKGEKG